MNTQKWAAWTEIVASVAVVITLVFLIYEVRQNTAAIERQTYLDRQARLIDPYLESPEFRTIYTKIKKKDGRERQVETFVNTYGLTDAEAVYWVRHLDENWTGLEADFIQFGPNEVFDNLIIGVLSFPDAALYWRNASESSQFSGEFKDYVESLRRTGQRPNQGAEH